MRKLLKIVLSICFIAGICLMVGCGENPTPTPTPGPVDPEPIDDPEPVEHTHDLVHHDAKDATCLDKGWDEYDTCNTCDYSTYKEIEALGHDFVLVEEQEATCTTSGYKKYKCSRCDEEKTEEIAALGHDLIHHEGKKAGIEAGWEEYDTCSRCDYTTYKEIPACSHEHERLTVVEPTKDKQGYVLHECDDCGESYYTDITGASGVFEDPENLPIYKVLFIGNSYTRYNGYSWTAFKNITEAEGYKVLTYDVSYASRSLMEFSDNTCTYGRAVESALVGIHYDYAFLQDQSSMPARRPGECFDGTRVLNEKLIKNGCKAIMFETWSYNDAHSSMKTYGWTYDSMSQLMFSAYEAIAEELNLPVSRVGTAFYYLHTEMPELEIYNGDNSHPSEIGTYVIALCHYATLYGKNPIGINMKYNDLAKKMGWEIYPTITDAQQAKIEEVVYRAIFGPSLVRDEYKMSSVGINVDTQIVFGYKATCGADEVSPSDWIDAKYKVTSGTWNAVKFDGITTFSTITDKSTLMFTNITLKQGDEISFNINCDGSYSGSYVQGIVLGSETFDFVYNSSTDKAYIIGRTSDGEVSANAVRTGSYTSTNVNVYEVDTSLLSKTNKNFRVKVVCDIDNQTYAFYVNQHLAIVVRYELGYKGGYFGFTNGTNGGITIGNIIINGKGLKAEKE